MTRDSAAAAVYEVAAGALARETIEPALGKDVYGIYRSNYSSSGVFTVAHQSARPAELAFHHLVALMT